MFWIVNAVRALVTIPNVIKTGAIALEGSPLVDGGISKNVERGDSAGVALKLASVTLGVAGTAAVAFGLVSNPVGWGILGASLAISLYDYYQDSKHDARERLAKEQANVQLDADIARAQSSNYQAITPVVAQRQPSQDVRLVEAIDPTGQTQTSPDTVQKKFVEFSMEPLMSEVCIAECLLSA
ncbi:MAG: hypothetical protein K2Q32_00885, partial [Alphaproteobacteria bacterium]|nr:hypothetical protein [Alphaproteobacteria bacterium]